MKLLLSLTVLLGSSFAIADEQPESGLFCPLAVEASAGLTETPEALQ